MCGQPGTERDYIVATLPNESGVQHYKLKCTSAYGINTGMNHARIEEHYFTDNAYYYAVKRDANSTGFMLLWFDEAENTPVRKASKNKFLPSTFFWKKEKIPPFLPKSFQHPPGRIQQV